MKFLQLSTSKMENVSSSEPEGQLLQDKNIYQKEYKKCKVMTISKYKTACTLLLVIAIFSTGHCYMIKSTLCENRCESATPYLMKLKTLWHRMSKRINRGNMTFESFVNSLIAASERNYRLISLRDNLLSMVGQYQDCVKACEHQHSKRSYERISDSYTRPQICFTSNFCL